MIWDWELVVLAFALGLGIGFLITWQMLPSNERNRELEKELDAARAELTAYRDKVTQHFQTSATLFEDMNERYRAVYQHLASSAQELCTERPEGLQLDADAIVHLPTSARDEADDATKKIPPVSTLERERISEDGNSYRGDAPNIPELTEEVDAANKFARDKGASTTR